MKYFLLILSVFLLLSCDSSTSPEKNMISGYVSLENSEDFSGVSVKLYKKNNDSIINLFDHRFTDFAYGAVTDTEGYYKISYSGNIQDYFIVFEKDGYGYKYQMGSNDNLGVGLYQEVIVPEIITGEYVFESDKHYIFNQNTNFLENSSIIIYRGSVLRVARNKRINIYGSIDEIVTNSNLWTKITSAGLETGDGICFTNVNTITLTNIINSNLANGINFEYCSNISLTDVIIHNNTNRGLLFSHCTDININNFKSQNINNIAPNSYVYSSEGAIQIMNCEKIYLSDVEIEMSQVGVKINNSQTGIIQELNIHDCYYGIELYESQIDVTNSYFNLNSKMDMRICGTGSPIISYNCFNSDLGLMVGLDGNYNYYNATPIINNNDLYCQNITLKLYGFNNIDINAINNYYNTTDINEINEKIIDGGDLGQTDDFYGRTSEFIILPFKNKPNS